MNKAELIETIKINENKIKKMNLRFRGTIISTLKSWGNLILKFEDENEDFKYDFEIMVSYSEVQFKKGLVKICEKIGFNEPIPENFDTIDIYSSYEYKKDLSTEDLMQIHYKKNGTKTEY